MEFPLKSPVLAGVLALIGSLPAAAATATVAVASNFVLPAQAAAERFEAASGHRVRIVAGSSGKLYAQIVNDAPFDLFLSADRARPQRLEASGRVLPGSRATYAIGRLVLWSRLADLRGRDCLDALRESQTAKVAIANPALAPYGNVAADFLARNGLLDKVSANLVYGENIAQTLQFAATGGAVFAFIAEAQLRDEVRSQTACMTRINDVPDRDLEQQLVLLRNNEAAREFREYLLSADGRDLITGFGYRLPVPGQ